MRAVNMAWRAVWLAGTLGAGALVVWALWPNAVAVGAVRVSRGTLAATVEAEGETRVEDLYEVSTPVDGTLERITVEPGDAVTSESTVARIAPLASRPLDARTRAEAEAAVAAARAAVSRADAAEREAETAVEHADSRLRTTRDMAASGAAPRNDAVHAGHEAELRHRALEEARAAARQARAELARAAAVIATATGAPSAAELEIHPQAAGRVLRVLRESGGPVSAGTPLLEVGDVGRLEVVADLLSSDAAEVRPGAAATIAGWGGPDLQASVRRVEPAAFAKVSALGLTEQRVHVILDLIDAPPPNLGHDYRVDVRIVVWEGKNVLRVPSTALFRSGDDWALFVVRGGRARLARVRVGRSNGTSSVVEQGVGEGEVVVTQPSDAVVDGARVEARLAEEANR